MNFYSGINGRYLRNAFPLHMINAGVNFENKYIVPIGKRDFWDNININLKEEIISKGNAYLDFVWKSIPISKTYLAYERGDEQDKDIINEKRNALGYLTIAEAIDNKGKYINQIIDGIFSICEETSWACIGHLSNTTQTRETLPLIDDPALDLGAARTAAILSFTYGTLREMLDKISPVICNRIEYEIEQRIFKPYLATDDLWWMGFNVDLSFWSINNWNPYINYHIIYSVLTVCKEKKIFYKVINKAIESLDVFVDSYPADGSCNEGVSYWSMAGAKLGCAIDLLNHMLFDKSKIWQNDKIKNIMAYTTKMKLFDDIYFAVSDSHIKNDINPYLLFSFGVLCEYEALKDEAKFILKQPYKCSEFNETNIMLEYMLYNAISNYVCNDKLSNKSSYLEGIQILIAHSNEEPHNGFTLCAKGGNNLESHNHNDIGEFVIYKNTNPIAIDVGVGTYTKSLFGEKRYTNWYTNGLYHNIPIINGVAQQEWSRYLAEGIVYKITDTNESLTMLTSIVEEAFVLTTIRFLLVALIAIHAGTTDWTFYHGFIICISNRS